jgi:hypothetical protein
MKSHLPFFHMISVNRRQTRSLLELATAHQKEGLKELAKRILCNKIPLTQNQVKSLQHHKEFIRALAQRKLSGITLRNNRLVLSKVAKIALNHEEHKKTGTRPVGRVGKAQRKKLARCKVCGDIPSPRRGRKTDGCSSDSSTSSTFFFDESDNEAANYSKIITAQADQVIRERDANVVEAEATSCEA